MFTAVGVGVAVVMATGYVVVSVGSVHVDPERQEEVGAVVAVTEVRLPLVENVPAFASVTVPVVNCVAETVTCHPGAIPVASVTRYDWCAAVVSTSCWSRPVTVPLHDRAVGEVRVSGPELSSSVPVIVHAVPAGTGTPAQAAASAVPPPSRTAMPVPPASSAQALSMRARRVLVMCVSCVIARPLPRLGTIATLCARRY